MVTTIRLNQVAALVNAVGIHAHVDHSGGGCWTLYAGDVTDDGYYECLVGPAVWHDDMDGPQSQSDDCFVGPDDQGETIPPYLPETATDQMVADLVVTCVNHHREARR